MGRPRHAEMTKEKSVVHLDASSRQKFSRHLIFRMGSSGTGGQQAAAFASNLAVGRYVRQLMVRLESPGKLLSRDVSGVLCISRHC